MPKNIFVLGLTDIQRGELETVGGPKDYAFHALLDYDSLVHPDKFVFADLLERARTQLDNFPGEVDAVIAHWDFPTSLLAPILAAERGIPAPSLTSLLKCEHKYWSRVEQRASVPEVVPGFSSFDPFDDDPLSQIGLEFPFWVKPIKAHSSQMGFEVHDAEELLGAVHEIRQGITHAGDAFDEVLDMIDVPEDLALASGTTCIAEQLISGVQAAPEGSVFQGEFTVHGLFDMHKDADGHSIERLDYPASGISEEVQQRMIDVSERFLRHIGYDNGCFNVEFMWDEPNDQLWLIEVNTRISQSHSDLFAKVDGVSNHEVAIEVALGQRPTMPRREGRFAVATKFMVGHYSDGIVRRVPGPEELERLTTEIAPDAVVELEVAPGDRLSDLPIHDSYRYDIATVYLGADDHEHLLARCDAVAESIGIEIDPPPEDEDQASTGAADSTRPDDDPTSSGTAAPVS